MSCNSYPSCHAKCALGPNVDHPGYLGYRCIDAGGDVLPWPASKYDDWEPWEDVTWD